MITSAFSSLWLGLIAGSLAGGLLGGVLAVFAIKFLVDQIILGVVLNVFASGLTGYLYDRDHVIKRSKLAGLDGKVLYKKPIDPERLKAIILERCAEAKKEGDRHGGGSESRRNSTVP